MGTPFVRSLTFSFLFIFSVTLFPAAPADARQDIVSGRVVDETGQPVGRAQVAVVRADGRTIATTFTLPDGTFRAHADPASGCTIAATLAGFNGVEARCASSEITLTLAVAPIREDVVVTATRSEAPTSQVAASVTVFDAAEIARRQSPLAADLLASAPGVTVVRAGGMGNVTSLFVRGGESNYTKVLLDGIPLNEPGGTFNFSNVTTGNIERIELVRGAQSALFGSDAMSGVVQLFTRRGARGQPAVDVTFEGGGYSTARAAAGVAGTRGGFDYSLFASRLTTDNRTPNNVFQNTTVSGTGGSTLGANAALRFVFRGEIGETGVPGATGFGRPDMDASFDRRDLVGGVTFDQQISGALHQRATYALATSRYVSTNLQIDPPYTPQFGDRVAPFPFSDFPYDSVTDLRRHYVAYQADLRLPPPGGTHGTHLLTAAVEWDGERATLENRLAGSSTDASRDNFGLTVQYEALWSRVVATAGLRVEHNASFGNAVVPRGSAAVVVRQSNGTIGETRIKAAAGLGIKEPTILQSFSASPSFLGNPDLEPERSRSVEAGVEQRFAHDRAKAEITWFDSRYENIISTRTISFNPFRSQYFNIGLTRARGVEVSGQVAPVRSVVARAGYTFLDSEILQSTSPASPVFAPGQWLFRRPRHSGFAEVSWTGGRAALDLAGRFVGRRVDSDFSSLQPPMTINEASYVWDARASYRLTRHLTGTAAVDNLTNARYFEPLGFPALGRVARAGVRVSF